MLIIARAFSSSLPEKPGSWSNAISLQMLLKIFFTFTIITVIVVDVSQQLFSKNPASKTFFLGNHNIHSKLHRMTQKKNKDHGNSWPDLTHLVCFSYFWFANLSQLKNNLLSLLVFVQVKRSVHQRLLITYQRLRLQESVQHVKGGIHSVNIFCRG